MSNKSIVKSLENATADINAVNKNFMDGQLKASEVSQYAKLHNAKASQIMAHIKAQEFNIRHGFSKAEAITLS
jgi:uncharacterized membrane protein